jgi:hypothetical protein
MDLARPGQQNAQHPRWTRVLFKIECVLRRTDPRLASKFGMFSRLASDEEMPWIATSGKG